MTLLETNIAAIRAREPELADIVARLPASPRIRREATSPNVATFTVTGPDGKDVIRLPNSDVPMVDSLVADLAKARMVVLLGFASGATFTQVVNKASDQTFVLLIEPDVDLFKAMLTEADFSSTLNNAKVALAIGESAQAATFIRAEKEYGVFTLKDFMVIEEPWSAPLYKSYFDETKKKLRELKEFGLQNTYTVSHLSGLWQKNILTNIPSILENRSVLDLFDKFNGVPAVIVAAGPSLEKTAFQLAVLKNRAIIIAVDTAVRPLLGVGVTPDIVVSLDAQYANYLHLKGISLPETLFVLNPSVHPLIVKEHTGTLAFCDYAEPLFIWLQKIIGEKGNVRAGGSVATSAFDLALKMGCSPVILTGQDMAYTGGQSHSGGTIQQTMLNGAKLDFTEDTIGKMDHCSQSDLFRGEDIFGQPVMSTLKMDSWRQWYELIISRESTPLLNATEGGLYIKGMIHLSMAEAIALALAKGKNITTVTPDQESGKRVEAVMLVEALAKARDQARTVKNICGKGISTAKATLDGTERLPDEADDGKNRLHEMNELSEKILEQEIFTETNRFGVDMTIDKVEQIGRGNGNTDDTGENMKTTSEAFLVLFSDLYKIASVFEKSVSGTLRTLGTAESVQ